MQSSSNISRAKSLIPKKKESKESKESEESKKSIDAMASRIKQEYLKIYGELIKSRKLLKPTELGYSGSASADTLLEFFRKIRLERFSSFADLGSGDGKAAIIASLFTRSTGIEIDSELVQISDRMKKLLCAENVCFIQADFLAMQLSDYDILFINPDQPLYEIEKKLRREMASKQRLIVFGGMYRPLNMKLEKEHSVQGSWFGIYSNR